MNPERWKNRTETETTKKRGKGKKEEEERVTGVERGGSRKTCKKEG